MKPSVRPLSPVHRGPTNHRRGESHGLARWPDQVVETARQLHDQGQRRPEIAKALGVPYDTLRDWLEYRTR